MVGRLQLVLAAVVACSSSPRPAVGPDGGAGARIAELRFEIANDPTDRAAHRELARLYAASGRPGAALRHYQRAGSAVRGGERAAVARLYLARARARLAAGDLAAAADLDRVATLGLRPVEMDRELVRRALYAAALAAFRRADDPGIAEAHALLLRAETAFGADPRQAARRPDTAPLEDLGAAAAWLDGGNARRAARSLYSAYRSRGGEAPAHRARWLRLERWWRGTAASSPLYEAGGCALAYTPADLGCARDLVATIASREVYDRAHRFEWQLRGAAVAAAMLPAALEAWLDGDRPGWLGGLAAIIEPGSIDVAGVEAAPAWAQGSLWRLSGDATRARAAVEQALSGDEPIDGRGAAVLIAEAAVQGLPLRSLGPRARGALAWRALARAARARGLLTGDRAFERELLRDAAGELRRAHHRVVADLGPLSALGDDLGLSAIARLRRVAPPLARRAAAGWRAIGWSPGRRSRAVQVVPIGGIDPARLAADVNLPDQVAALSAIARAHGRDPALAERLATDWLDGAVSALTRGPALVELFARAGDPRRADRFARLVLAESEQHPDSLATAAETAAALGDQRRARVLLILAASRSGDAGATARGLARSFLASGAIDAALEAGRWALSLTPPGEDVELLELVARALLARGRRANAVETLDRLRQRLGSPARIDRILEADGGPVARRPRPDFADPIEAAAWNPGDPDLVAAALAAPRAPAWLEPQLASIALGAGTPRARRALLLWSARLRPSNPRLAAALALEARRLPGD